MGQYVYDDIRKRPCIFKSREIAKQWILDTIQDMDNGSFGNTWEWSKSNINIGMPKSDEEFEIIEVLDV